MSSDIEQKIIESLYNVTIDPSNYDELLRQWEDEFFDIPDDLNVEDYKNIDYKPQHLNQAIENHFIRALAILDLIGEHVDKKPTLKEIIEADPLPSFIIDSRGQLILSNSALTTLLAGNVEQNIVDLPFSEDSQKKIFQIRERLYQSQEKTSLGLVQFDPSNIQNSPDFVLSKIYDANSKANYIHATALQTTWNDEKNATIQNLFQLTDSELDVARRLFSGDKISDMAVDKHRSIFTIRTQVRAIFKKTNIKTQSELIKLFATLQGGEYQEKNYVLQQVDPPKSPLILSKQDNNIIRQGQRKLYYEIYGKPKGKPVLFLHGMISGTKLSHNIISQLWKSNIKLICPHRAGFGYSEIDTRSKNLDHFVDDMAALLDHEEIDNCPIIGHLDGGYYAYLLGSRLAERVERIRNINACVPIRTAKQLNEASPRQRITAYTALYTPKLLPFILRAGIAQVRKNGVASMMNALFKDSEYDMMMLADEEIGEIMINGFESCIANGIDSFVNDMTNVISGNWSDLIDSCSMPIELFHARNEHVVPVAQVRDLVEYLPKLELTELEGGQIILYKYPEIFFRNL